MAFSLPRLKSDLAIVKPANGKPTRAFEVFVNQQILTPLESAIQNIQQNILDLQAAFAAIQAVNEVAQAAQQAANTAQETADTAGGGTALSGSETGTVNPTGVVWSLGPVVALTGVAAGDLTITGSGPQQSDTIFAEETVMGQFRIVEIVGGVDTAVFTGSYTVYPGSPATVLNNSGAAVSAFTSARASTGSVSYRMDVNKTNPGVPPSPVDLDVYIFVRRS